jgi:predicted RNA-binding protein
MFLTHPDNWQKCLEHGLFGFDKEYAYTVEHFIRPGDQAIIYLAKDSAIWGVVEITDILLDQTAQIGWLKKGWEARKGEQILGAFPARVRFRPVCALKPPRKISGADNQFRDQLEYITDKKRWNVFVQIALSRVPEADVRTVMAWSNHAAD